MPIQRKYDFQPGTRVSSSQVDEEFDQLVSAVNQAEQKAESAKSESVSLTSATKQEIVSDIDLKGVLNLPNQSYVDIYRSGNLSVASSVNTNVSGFIKTTDRQGEFAGDAITVKESGIYAVYTYTIWNAFSASKLNTLLYVNGTNAGPTSEHNTGGITQTSYGIGTTIRDFAAGDKIEFYVSQNNGATQSMATMRVRVVKLA